jgi:hypothetical protein
MRAPAPFRSIGATPISVSLQAEKKIVRSGKRRIAAAWPRPQSIGEPRIS